MQTEPSTDEMMANEPAGDGPATQRRAPASEVFVGGSGRSGTTVTARLLGRHSRFAFIPGEIKFHVDPAGIPALLAGRIGMADFQTSMHGRHYRYRHHTDRERGLYRLVDDAAYDEALKAFEREFAQSPVDACARLVRAVLDPCADREGKAHWVESTPRNAVAGSWLQRLFPEMRLIHSVRDGRDVAASMYYRWGMQTDSVFDALAWWGRKMLRAERQYERLGDQMLVIRMEDLVRDDRDNTYSRLLDFLGIDDEPEMRAYFESDVVPEKAGIGGWTALVPPEEIERFDARYHELIEELRDQQVASVDLVAPEMTRVR